MGSWAATPSWTAQELSNSSGYDSLAVAPYLFNSLNDYGSNEAIFGPMFAQPEQVDSSPTATGNYMYQQAQAAAAGSPAAKLAVSEVNLEHSHGNRTPEYCQSGGRRPGSRHCRGRSHAADDA